MSIDASRRVKLILHVGFHKTGSSSIQETFSKLDMPHIEYADWGNSNHSGPFLYAFLEPKTEIYGVGEAPDLLAAAEAKGARRRTRLREVLETCPKSALMISAETVSSDRNAQAVRAFREFVDPYVSEIAVHAYVRPHAEIMVSRFQQQVKMGNRGNLSEADFYRPMFEMLENVFGAENVQYHPFQRASLFGADVVKDMAHRLGVTVEDHEIVRANSSISAEEMGALFCHLKFGRHRLGYSGAARVQKALLKELGGLGSTPFRFSAELVRKNLDILASDVAWVEQRIGLTSVVPQHGDGITTEADLLAQGVAQHDKLAAIAADLGRREGCVADLPSGPAGPQTIAAMVDVMKDILRVTLDREREAARRNRRQRDRVARDDIEPMVQRASPDQNCLAG